jgi:hypothetical protein
MRRPNDAHAASFGRRVLLLLRVLLLKSVTPAVPSIPVPLNKVARPRARARADRRALLAADQSAADPARDAADNSPFGSAVMMPSIPPLNGEPRGCERP